MGAKGAITDWFLMNPDTAAFHDREGYTQLPGYIFSSTESPPDNVKLKEDKHYLPREINHDENGKAMIQALKDLLPKLDVSLRRSNAALDNMMNKSHLPYEIE